MRRRHRRCFWLVIAVLVAGAIWGVCSLQKPPPVYELLRAAESAHRERRFHEAEELARQALAQEPNSAEALLIAGSAAAADRRIEEALAYYSRVPSEARVHRATALSNSAELLFLELGRISDAEQSYRQALEMDPSNVWANKGLAYLLFIEGRRWESAEYVLELIRQDQFEIDHLLWLSAPVGASEALAVGVPFLEKCERAVPTDPLPSLGLAQFLLERNRVPEAKERLKKVVSAAPDIVEAQVALGDVLLDSASDEEFTRWQNQLPSAADSHPETWSIRGRWAQKRGQRKVAVRCFIEAVRRNPNDLLASYPLSVLLSALGENELAGRFRRHARCIIDYRAVVNEFSVRRDNMMLMQRAAELTESLGRLWEAWAWCRKAFELQPGLDWAQRRMQRLKSELKAKTPQTVRSANPTEGVDLSRWPLPQRISTDGLTRERLTVPQLASVVRFEDLAAKTGIEFHYFNGHDPRREGVRLYEVYGGGVAAFDYDCDGWPDLYFTQGCEWPARPGQKRHLDRLYRNLGNARFEDVTMACGIRENRFGQGVTAGDIDDDGFVDVYVANIGGNRLYRNNGDGTFSDVTAETMMGSTRWTCSCAIADLNGDALPDIYDVNYLTGSDVFDRVCRSPSGRLEVCNPQLFEGERDQVHLNLGNGQFEEKSAEAGIAVEKGKGLGLVVADFDGSGKLSLFVANDQIYNYYFRNETDHRGAPLRFQERGFLSGLAVSAEGQGQACMGVAAGDANGDGLLDLFVTNFSEESNCLYLQQPGHFFTDAARQAGLTHASYQMLGFGTQFLDGELDGFPDIVLTNGHVEDRTDLGSAYRMRPQYYRNDGTGRFVELAAESLGTYFQKKNLGRGMARLDWNRDGREDFAVSNLDGPVALVMNQTQDAGNFIAIQLRGTYSDRDAIGAEVQIVCGDLSRVRQLVAGDGFQSCNQRQLVFGIGKHDRIDNLTVRWPSGLKQSWCNLEANAEVLLVEGRPEVFRLPR